MAKPPASLAFSGYTVLHKDNNFANHNFPEVRGADPAQDSVLLPIQSPTRIRTGYMKSSTCPQDFDFEEGSLVKTSMR